MGIEEIIGKGSVGGKAAGFFKAKQHLERMEIRFPRTVCIATEFFNAFVRENNLAGPIQKYKWDEESAFEQLRTHFLAGQFSKEALSQFRNVLSQMTYPLAIRSSSLLEDRPQTSFAGKYTTLFISNRGSPEERLAPFCHAVRQVYASVYNPNAMNYRKKHKLLKEKEEMAIMVQEAIGSEYKGWFLPLMAGVGFSQNGYRWNPEIKKEDGLVRLVFGFGTRAVGRGYARLFSPGKPMTRPEGTATGEIVRFSQEIVDVLDLRENVLKQIRIEELVKDGFECYPHAQKLFSLNAEGHLYIPPTNIWNKDHKPVLTFDGILLYPWMGLDLPKTIQGLFRELEKKFGCPVDLEFAIRVAGDTQEARFYLVQCRPLTQREDQKSEPLPKIPNSRKIFSVLKQVPTASLKKIEYLIYVDPLRYKNWPAHDKPTVARIIGKLNRRLEDKIFVLMGPGRWGTMNPDLGVPVKYAEISNAKMLVEMSLKEAQYLPEVSYGTHFFQDLIEGGVIYVPLFPDDEGVAFHPEFFEKGDVFQKILSNEYYARYKDLIKVIHIPSATDGCFAEGIFNGRLEQGMLYIRNP